MDPAPAPGMPVKSIVFLDGLGERRRISDVSGADAIEMLCLRDELTAIPSFEFALRERTSRLASFRHVYYSHVRSIDRLNDPAATLAVVSDSIKGVRLSNLLAANEKRPLTLDINAAVHLIRQLVSAVALLHESSRDASHGALAPERIIVTPNARVVVVEYVLGAALEQLHFSHERYWKELRIALPPSPGLPRFDHRADVTQIGVVALSLVLGRLLREDEYPGHISEALASARAVSSKGQLEPLSGALRSWLARALQLDPRHSFASAVDASDELARVLSGDEEEEEEEEKEEKEKEKEKEQDRSHTPALGIQTAPPVTAPMPAADAPKVEPARISAPVVRPPVPPPPKIAASAPDSAPVPTERHYGENDEDEIGRNVVRQSRPWGRMAAVAVALVAVSTAGVFGVRRYLIAGSNVPSTGTLNINTNPPGAQVVVDGQANGVTPLTVTLHAGSHLLELRGAGEPRTVPITITAGTQVSQYVELPQSPTTLGQLQIRTEPEGAQVAVDGIPRGKSPVLIEALAPGEHAVVLESDIATVKQSVVVEVGQTASLVVPLTPAESAQVSGWLSVSALPVELQLYEKGRLIGSSQSERLMMSAGKHDIEMVNENVGYHAVRTIQVLAGKVTPINVEWPKGTISINALPWADVWIDGERIGETPIGNLSLAIGPHEIVFRHPELGEQKYAVTVSLKAPVRVSLDLRQKP